MTQIEYRSLDETSRVLIPKKFREELHLKPKSRLKIYTEDNRIIIEKTGSYCRMCGSNENMIEGFPICRPCAEKAAFLLEASKENT